MHFSCLCEYFAPNTSLKLKFSLHSENKEKKSVEREKKCHCKVISFCV